MGQELKTTVRWDGRIIDVMASLAGGALVFQGGLTMSIPFGEMMSVESNGGFLDFKTSRGLMMLELGPKADAWKEKIKNPNALLEKLGLGATKKVCVVGKLDAGLRSDIDTSGAKVAKTARGKDFDAIFFAPGARKDLEKMPSLKDMIADDGAIWFVYPKGLPPSGADDALTERAILTSGRILGLTDSKPLKLEDDLVAVRFIIPAAQRKKRG